MNYIAFEGIDGSGKSTQYRRQVDRLRSERGEDVVKEYLYSSKENPIGRMIKRAYRKGTNNPLSFLTRRRFVQEALYALNARHNLGEVPSPEEGILLSDRSIVTAHASHVGVLPEWYVTLAEPSLSPDLAIFIDIPPEVGIARISGRDVKFKDEDLEGLRIFYEGYRQIFNGRRPKPLRSMKVEIIDGTQSVERVAADVTTVVDGWLNGGRR